MCCFIPKQEKFLIKTERYESAWSKLIGKRMKHFCKRLRSSKEWSIHMHVVSHKLLSVAQCNWRSFGNTFASLYQLHWERCAKYCIYTIIKTSFLEMVEFLAFSKYHGHLVMVVLKVVVSLPRQMWWDVRSQIKTSTGIHIYIYTAFAVQALSQTQKHFSVFAIRDWS